MDAVVSNTSSVAGIEPYFQLNQAICAVVVAAGAVVFLVRWWLKRPTALDFTERKSTAWAFLLWLAWWISMVYGYWFQSAPIGTSLHTQIFALFGMDIGDLCLLGSAIAYCSGDKTFTVRRFTPLPVAAILFGLYYVLFETFVSSADKTLTPLGSVWLFSPSVVVSNVAVFALGWSFLVRWGMTALPFFFVTIAYAMCQYPAYLHGYVVRPFELIGSMRMENSFRVYYYLAIGKLAMAVIPSAFWFGPSRGELPDTSFPKSWPSFDTRVPLPARLRSKVAWIVSITAVAILAAVLHELVMDCVKWVGHLLGF